MATKASGAEFKKFYTDKTFWPDGVWHDDDVITVDGEDDPNRDLENVPDASVVVIHGGYVIGPKDEDLGPLEGYFKKWRRAQAFRCLAVEVPVDKVEWLKDLVSANGGKVSS